MKRITAVRNTGPLKSKAILRPVRFLAAEHQRTYVAYVVALLSMTLSPLLLYLSLKELDRDERIFVIDGSHTIHIGPLESMTASSEVLSNISLLVNQVIFTRNPEGLSLPEIARHLFRKNALEKLQSDVEEQAEVYQAKQWYQQVEVSNIQSVVEGGIKLVKTEGTVIRSGVFEGIALAESEHYTLLFKLTKNPHLSDSSLYPFIVSDFKFFWENEA